MARSAPAASGPTRRQFVALTAGAAIAACAGVPLAAAAPAKVPRGFNLPGWTDREGGVAPASAVLERLRAAGFDTIRLPVAAGPILGGDTRAMMRRIADAISLCRDCGFDIVLDLHPDGDFAAALRQDPAEGARRAEESWRRLGDVVAAFPASTVQAELLNEPPMEQPRWLDLRDRLAAIVREPCPYHRIVWGPARYQGIWELADVRPLGDPRATVAIHYYAPMAFTHQCENWSGSALGRVSKLPFPATMETPAVAALRSRLREAGDAEALAMLEDAFSKPWDVNSIAADFAEAAAWGRRHGCPILLGEFGVLDFCVDPQSRTNWIRAVRQAAEANGIGWTYWELDQGFGFIRDRRSVEGFDAAMIDALAGTA
jgi:endoglucanase